MKGKIPTFDSWSSIPVWLKTEGQWKELGLRPKKEAIPSARKIDPKIVEVVPKGFEVLEDFGNCKLVTEYSIPLFRKEDCAPYQAKPETIAARKFYNIFCKPMNKGVWISKTDFKTKNELPNWHYCRAYKSRHGFEIGLDYAKVKSHLDHNEILGVIGLKKTRFVIIDLDLHGGNRDVFLDQTKVLLDFLHGKGGWHYQISDDKVTGIHFIKVFKNPICIEKLTKKIRALLNDFDHKHPVLANAAKQAKMKSIGELEIYPTKGGNGVRLPLCKNRVMITDQVLGPVTRKKSRKASKQDKSTKEKEVGDVVKYINWLEDPAKKYVTAEQVINFVGLMLISNKDIKGQENSSVLKPNEHQWNKSAQFISKLSVTKEKVHLIEKMRGFWIEGAISNLNNEFITLYQLCLLYGHSPNSSFEGIMELVFKLNKETSMRLQKGDMKKIREDLKRTASKINTEFSNPRTYKENLAILKRFLDAYTYFDPLDTTTWDPDRRPNRIVSWSEEDRQRLISYLKPILKTKKNSDDIVIEIVNWIIRLVQIKSGPRKGFGRAYLKVWGKKNFPSIKWGNDHKLSNFLIALQKLRVIYPVQIGNKGNTATVWGLGALAKMALENGTQV
jgi:hypothetical protein